MAVQKCKEVLTRVTACVSRVQSRSRCQKRNVISADLRDMRGAIVISGSNATVRESIAVMAGETISNQGGGSRIVIETEIGGHIETQGISEIAGLIVMAVIIEIAEATGTRETAAVAETTGTEIVTDVITVTTETETTAKTATAETTEIEITETGDLNQRGRGLQRELLVAATMIWHKSWMMN